VRAIMKVSRSPAVTVPNPALMTKADKALESKAKAAVVKELKAKNPGVKNIKVEIPRFEGLPGSSPKSRFEHYGFMNVHVSGQLPGGKKVEFNPSYNAESGTMIWR
jgi:hypothetical protein